MQADGRCIPWLVHAIIADAVDMHDVSMVFKVGQGISSCEDQELFDKGFLPIMSSMDIHHTFFAWTA
jgi:hypothetical protein